MACGNFDKTCLSIRLVGVGFEVGTTQCMPKDGQSSGIPFNMVWSGGPSISAPEKRGVNPSRQSSREAATRVMVSPTTTGAERDGGGKQMCCHGNWHAAPGFPRTEGPGWLWPTLLTQWGWRRMQAGSSGVGCGSAHCCFVAGRRERGFSHPPWTGGILPAVHV